MCAGCGSAPRANVDVNARLRFVASQATQATWSFRVDDHARAAELLVDGRPRTSGCDRAGRQVRCELFGLWPGGHRVELRLPGALLRRSVLIGRPWPERPLLVRARDADEAQLAADAGADGVILDERTAGSSAELSDLVDLIHAHGARAVVIGADPVIELASADALLGAPGRRLPGELAARFPEARVLAVDETATQSLARAGESPAALDQVLHARGLVESQGGAQAALALLSPAGAIVDAAGFPLLRARRRHAALRTGAAQLDPGEAPRHVGFSLRAARDAATVLVNLDDAPWEARSSLAAPLDLLGSRVNRGTIEIAPHDAAVLITAPAPDQTRY